MAFVLPTFNLTCNVWHFPNSPGTGPPDEVIPCQLRAAPAAGLVINAVHGLEPGMIILFPPLADVRDDKGGSGSSDYLECPAGSGRIYDPIRVDDIAKGFPNEHRFAVVAKFGTWPDPIP